MRFIFLFFTILSLPLLSFAQTQTQKGSFIFGGGGALNASSSNVNVTQDGESVNEDGPHTLNLNIIPDIAYFLADNFTLGPAADYSLQRISIDDTRTTDGNFWARPMLRGYLPFDNNNAIFLHVGLGFGTFNDDLMIDIEVLPSTTHLLKISIGPGLTLFSNGQVGIEVAALYNFNRSNVAVVGDVINTQTITNTNEFDVRIGVPWYLNRN